MAVDSKRLSSPAEISQTLADWSGQSHITDGHLIEASQYRPHMALTEEAADPPAV